MSDTQSIKEPKVENSIHANPVEVAPSDTSAPKAEPAAKESFVDTLRVLGTSWAGTALGYSRVALENVAQAIERAAEKLGELQDKLKKSDVAAAAAR